MKKKTGDCGHDGMASDLSLFYESCRNVVVPAVHVDHLMQHDAVALNSKVVNTDQSTHSATSSTSICNTVLTHDVSI
jgi:hypothetical protein